jgi:hypothetical protein
MGIEPGETREELANERRTVDRRDDAPSVVEVVEDAVDAFAKPLSNQRPSDEDVERQREANDAEQRRPPDDLIAPN